MMSRPEILCQKSSIARRSNADRVLACGVRCICEERERRLPIPKAGVCYRYRLPKKTVSPPKKVSLLSHLFHLLRVDLVSWFLERCLSLRSKF
jgi:hypothetical protein